MFKNVASQKLIVFAFDTTTGAPKTGDAANITAYVSKDYGTVTVLGDTSATEMDSTNAKGYYLFDLTQGETNGDTLLFSAKSSTANVSVIGAPATVFTVAPNFSSLSVDSSGRVDVAKIAGTSQTARDIGASVLLSSGTSTGQISLSSGKVAITAAEHALIADEVWDEAISGHLGAGSTGASLNAASSAGDPWATALPGAYSAGQAGKIIGDNINATISSRLAGASYTAPDNSSITAIKAKTDNLPASPAATGDIPTATQNADALLKRDMSAVTGEAARSPLNALRLSGINKLDVSGSVLTAYKENDTTPALTRTLGTSASADPVVSMTP